jgi:hypothetical protein
MRLGSQADSHPEVWRSRNSLAEARAYDHYWQRRSIALKSSFSVTYVVPEAGFEPARV